LKEKVLFFSRLIASLAILVWLLIFVFKENPYERLVELYQDSHKIYLILGFLIFCVSVFLGVGRWRFLLSCLGIKISLREAFYAYFCGLFLNLFFPSFVAGDLFRGFSISYRHGDLKKAASSVIMDRFNGGVALVSLAIVSFAFAGGALRTGVVAFPLLFLCFICGIVSLAIFSKSFFRLMVTILKPYPSIHGKLIRFHEQLYFFRKNPKAFFATLAFSYVIHILTVLGFYTISRAFGVDINFLYFLILIPLIMAIAVVPITIAGAGTREASAVYFFSLLGIDKSIGLGISLVNLLFMIAASIAGGVVYVSVYHRWFQRVPSDTRP
jgi:hypothetical protein